MRASEETEFAYAFVVILGRMSRAALRELSLAPLSRADAARLLAELAARRRLTSEERLLRGRCRRVLESFHTAWDELSAFREQQRDPLLRSRAEIDLVYLAYYLVRRERVEEFATSAERQLAGRPLLSAELHLALSVVYTGEDRIADAFRDAQFAQDALGVAPPGREKDLVAAALDRQLAHLLAYATSYDDAQKAAERAAQAAQRTADAYEVEWARYARGFALWHAGRLEEAREAFDGAESALRDARTSLWRWTLFCLAMVEAELGMPQRGQRLAAQSGFGTPDGLAYLALRRGDLSVAEEIVDAAPEQLDPPTRAVLGLIRCHRGDERMCVRLLEEARVAFQSKELVHYALSCQIHGGYWRERQFGGGADRAVRAFAQIAAGGGEGFHWYDAAVARWLAPLAARRTGTRTAAARMAERAERILAEREPEAPSEATIDAAVPYLRSRGLTAREINVLRAVEEMTGRGDRDRDALAKRLAMSPNTLRVHLTRIRSKLDVGSKRGDDTLLAAALRRG